MQVVEKSRQPTCKNWQIQAYKKAYPSVLSWSSMHSSCMHKKEKKSSPNCVNTYNAIFINKILFSCCHSHIFQQKLPGKSWCKWNTRLNHNSSFKGMKIDH